MKATQYLHGTSPEEQRRLDWMNALLNERELAQMALRGEEHVLEMGAGTGVFARALARRLPRGRVTAVELDDDQLAAARASTENPPHLEFRSGDAFKPPLEPTEWGAFDLVHARFLLEHLTDPAGAVEVMARAVRPGGRVILVDDDHDTLRLWPASPGFEDLWKAYSEQYLLRGMDPWVGRRLVALLARAGLEPVDATQLFFGACAGMQSFATVMANMIGVVAGAASEIVRTGARTQAQVEAGLAEMRPWCQRGDAALWYAVPYAVGVRPV